MGSTGRCLIIGGGGGIGRALAARLAHSGWDLLLAGRTESSLQPVAEMFGAQTAALDASDFDAMADLFESNTDLTGAVNLAGSILLKPAHSTSASEFQDTLTQNIGTAFSMVRAAGKTMRPRGGSLVLMSSCAASVGLPNHEAIAAAKGAVEGLTRSAAASYAGSNLRINAVAPGLVDTPMASRITGNAASLKASEAMHPLGRIGTADEIAGMIAHLLSEESAWITGQVFGVDGGLGRVRSR